MRSVTTVLATAVAILGMIVVLPSMWMLQGWVSPSGFSDQASKAARTTEVQDYFADQIGEKVQSALEIPYTAEVATNLVRPYVRSDDFVEDFTAVADQQHAWLFEKPAAGTDPHVLQLNITTMVQRIVDNLPSAVVSDAVRARMGEQIIVDVDQEKLRAGDFEMLGHAVRIAAWGSLGLAVVGAVLAVISARRRFTIVGWLGLGAVASGIGGLIVARIAESEARSAVSTAADATRKTVELVVQGVADELSTTSYVVLGAGAIVVLIGLGGRTLTRI